MAGQRRRKLEKGDFFTMDFGAKLDGYCSDVTRTVVVGEASDRHREIYGLVLRSHMAALAAMKPGVNARDVDRISREAMGDHATYFTHGLGHGLGKFVHDSGRMNSTSETVLAPKSGLDGRTGHLHIRLWWRTNRG